MAFKVPTYEKQTSRISPQISGPSSLRPPEGAFGNEVAEATIRLGETGTRIANALMQRAVERKKEIHAKQIADQDTAFRTEMQDVLYSAEPNDKGVPSGFFSRKLDQTAGATNEFDANYPKMKERYLNNVATEEQKRVLGKMLDDTYTSRRDSIIRYERDQTDVSIANSLESNIDIQANDAAQLSDGPSVVRAIQRAEDVQMTINKIKGYDGKTSIKNLIETRGKIVKSAFSTAMAENDLDKAKVIFEASKGSVPAETQQKMQEEIESGIPYKRAVQDAFLDPIGTREKVRDNAYGIKDPVKRKAAFDFTNNLANTAIAEHQESKFNTIIGGLAEEKYTLTDVENEMQIPEEKGGVKKSILLNIQKSLQSGISKKLNMMLKEKTADGDLTGKAQAVKEYNDLIDGFLDDSRDKWRFREELVNAYSRGIADPQEMAYLNKLKTDLKHLEFNQSTGPITSMIKGVKSWLKDNNASDEEITLNIKQLLGTLQKGEGKPEEISQAIIKAHTLRKIPELPTYSAKGQIMIDGYGNLGIGYPDGRVEGLMKNKPASTKGTEEPK